jgi:glycosyltransferase involved in cell wall biosynthesis
MEALRWLVLAGEVVVALPVAYLMLVTLAATVASLQRWAGRRRVVDALPATFAILIPAHDEASIIERLLASLAQLDYPRERHAVYVIADNCTDTTADLARAAGATVYERSDATKRGKGYALAWAFARLLGTDPDAAAPDAPATPDPAPAVPVAAYDAYIVLDADAVVDPDFLRALARGLATGATALQASNAVLNVADSPSTALRWLALTLVNHVRPLGRNRLGGSSTLTGNGMCLTHDLLQRHPWRAFGLAEDYQYYLMLAQDGERVVYVPDARVRSTMPTTFQQMQSQDIRWESLGAGQSRWQRRVAWHLLSGGLRHHDWVRLDALAELLAPPLSFLASASVLLVAAAALLRAPLQIALALGTLGGLLLYVASAFYLLRPPAAVYTALLHAPRFAARKLWIYFVLRRSQKHTSAWVRTSRS